MSQTVAVSIGVGIGIAVILTRLAASLLYQLEPTDPLTFAITIFVLLLVSDFSGIYSGAARFESRPDVRAPNKLILDNVTHHPLQNSNR